jgi:glyoxalase family protein
MNEFHLLGLHHVTATVHEAAEDYAFYAGLLGLRLVKQTVNFDNPKVFHFYYGTRLGAPGTLMTTFPYAGQGVRQGKHGTGQVDVTSFSVPPGSLGFWQQRLSEAGVQAARQQRFGGELLAFSDPSGLGLELAEGEDPREPWQSEGIPAEAAIRGLHSATLSLARASETADFLTRHLGFAEEAREGNYIRLGLGEGGPGQRLDLREDPERERGLNGIGTVHHVAFRVRQAEELSAIRAHVLGLGLLPTELKDRNYFRSVYFRIPAGVLFEIATLPPGFTADEPEESLGQELKLPEWEEARRAEIEGGLPRFR